MSGTSSSPELVALTPLTTCRKSGRKMIAPNMLRPTTNDATDGEREHPVAEQAQGQDRLGGAALLHQEQAEQHDGGGAEAEDGRAIPTRIRCRPTR